MLSVCLINQGVIIGQGEGGVIKEQLNLKKVGQFLLLFHPYRHIELPVHNCSSMSFNAVLIQVIVSWLLTDIIMLIATSSSAIVC